MSLTEIASIDLNAIDLVSVDLFDTVLLRDHSLQRERFAQIAREISVAVKRGGRPVSTGTLLELRSALHVLAYRAVAIERPAGDTTLDCIHRLLAQLLGGSIDLASLLRVAELEVERQRLSANRPLITLLDGLAAAGKRIVAVSDTYYSAADLEWIIARVVGPSPIKHIYASCDLGLTKHSGKLFHEVAAQERVELTRILHCGDDRHADVRMASAAGCRAVHLPRPPSIHLARKAHAIWYVIKHMTTISST